MPSGGTRKGAGRKAGDAWASTKPVPARVVAKARVRKILSGSDPLAVLCRIAADEAAEKHLRVTAASAACPYLFPRLSAAVTASITPESRADPIALLDKLSTLIGRYAPAQKPQTIDAEPVPV